MALERKRPLPPGRYWADVFPQNLQAFQAWGVAAGMLGAVDVESSEHFPGVDGAPEHDFVIFRTNRALEWPDKVIGFAPNIADASVKSSGDTATRPPPEPDAIDKLNKLGDELAKTVTTALAVGLGIAAVAGAVALLRRARRR